MKNRLALGILAVGLLSMGALAGCGKKGTSSEQMAFSFMVSLDNGSTYLNKDSTANILIDAFGGNEGDAREYVITSSNPAVAAVNSAKRTVTAVAVGEASIMVKENNSGLSQILDITVIDAQPASGGYNYASLAGDEAIAKRTEILGQLEKYAMENHLTGIPLFENGGYVKYSSRVTLPTNTYVTGYGFGLLSEGSIDRDMPSDKENNPKYARYLHSAMSAPDPMKINARNDKGAQVGDLEGYITSSFWGTKLSSDKTSYVWYPVLAKDTVKYNGVDQAFDRPIPVDLEKDEKGHILSETEVKPGQDTNPLGLYRTWRIYVKTGEDGGVKFRYNGASWGQNFDGRNVTIEDYEFAYRFLLTGSHGMVRGTEMAGDETYGIVGARKYNSNTKESNDEQAKDIWNSMKANGEKGPTLGLQTGHDATNGDYIQLTLLNPIDRFTAMYTLSSSLLSPMNEDFIRAIGGGASDEKALSKGAKRYGLFNDNDSVPAGHQNQIVDYVLSVGPYMLEHWDKNQAVIFQRNDQWNEPGRYKIAGVKLIIVDTSKSSTAIYDKFNDGLLDSCGVPSKKKIIDEELAKGDVYQTKGDSTFKLNVNSCTQETWNEQFGPEGKISKNSNWTLKPWMSNDNFLNGLYYSIDRKTFAKNRGMQPSTNYFSNAYLSDPEKGISYNDTNAHKQAVAAFQTTDSTGESTYGYSLDRAILCFQTAVKQLVKDYPDKINYGTKENPFKISFHIKWMYQTDTEDYGNEIKKYFEDAFNNERVCGGRIKLEVTQDAVTNWQDVYYEYLMKGQFDLGFGAISGNTYNPLNFLEVLKSNNSSGFTLNWGNDTSKISTTKPLIYENKLWSFDALWAVADHGGVVDNGSVAKNVEKSYIAGKPKNAFHEGLTFNIATKFIDKDSAKFDVTRIQIYVFGSGGYDVDFTKSIVDGLVNARIVLSAELANEINQEMRRVNKMDDPDKPKQYNETPFTLENYGRYWYIELSYSISIKPEGSTEFGAPSESYTGVAKNEAAWSDDD